MQRAEAYWGAFDYSGLVVRDVTNAHYTPELIWGEDVFPPYARGAALAMSIDLVRQIVDQEEKQPFRKIIVEDVSYGFYLWQIVFERDLGSVTLLDNDEKHFAMDLKCCTEQSHPNNCWLPLSSSTWIVHHASPKIVRCMFEVDTRAGLYQLDRSAPLDGVDDLVSKMLPHDSTLHASVGTSRQFVPSYVAREGPFPELCSCVYTPPAHPGDPKQTGGLKELASGPRLNVN